MKREASGMASSAFADELAARLSAVEREREMGVEGGGDEEGTGGAERVPGGSKASKVRRGWGAHGVRLVSVGGSSLSPSWRPLDTAGPTISSESNCRACSFEPHT